MNIPITPIRRRRALAFLTVPIALISCGVSRVFRIAWEEEVQLHDGTTVLAALEYSYERIGGSVFERYGPSILRTTRIAFDAGPGIGTFAREFDKHRVDLIERLNGAWYLVLETRGGPPSQITKDGRREEIWGPIENASGQKCWRLDQRGFTRASLRDLPQSISRPNVLMDYAPFSVLAKLNAERVTLAMKTSLESRFTVSPPAGRIERPYVPYYSTK